MMFMNSSSDLLADKAKGQISLKHNEKIENRPLNTFFKTTHLYR